MQLQTADLQFLERLSKSPDGARIIELLRRMIAEHGQAARAARGEDVHRALGAADGLDKFVAMILSAEQSLARAAAPPRRIAPVARP